MRDGSDMMALNKPFWKVLCILACSPLGASLHGGCKTGREMEGERVRKKGAVFALPFPSLLSPAMQTIGSSLSRSSSKDFQGF